jgi:hypothetical protein
MKPIPIVHWTHGKPAVEAIDPELLRKPTRELDEAAIAALVDELDRSSR